MRCDTADPYRAGGGLNEQLLDDVLVHGMVPQGPYIK